MAAALYWWRASRRQTWRSVLVVVVLCGILGAAALGALAGARRTESAYGRYLTSINASDVMVNIPSPDTSLIAKVEGLPGIRASAAWLGLNANPVVHGRVDLDFQTDNMAGGLHGEFVTQDVVTVVKGRLPRGDDEVALTARLADLFGVGVGGTVRYQYLDSLAIADVVTGYSTYRVVGIVELPPVLVDQFDQVQGAILPQAATARRAPPPQRRRVLLGGPAPRQGQRGHSGSPGVARPPGDEGGRRHLLRHPQPGDGARAGPRGHQTPGRRARRVRGGGAARPAGPGRPESGPATRPLDQPARDAARVGPLPGQGGPDGRSGGRGRGGGGDGARCGGRRGSFATGPRRAGAPGRPGAAGSASTSPCSSVAGCSSPRCYWCWSPGWPGDPSARSGARGRCDRR